VVSRSKYLTKIVAIEWQILAEPGRPRTLVKMSGSGKSRLVHRATRFPGSTTTDIRVRARLSFSDCMAKGGRGVDEVSGDDRLLSDGL